MSANFEHFKIGAVKLHVVFSPGTGHFEIMEGDSLAASGKMTMVDEPTPFFYEKQAQRTIDDMLCDRIELGTDDIYKEFLLRGYEYGPEFRGIYKTRNSGVF